MVFKVKSVTTQNKNSLIFNEGNLEEHTKDQKKETDSSVAMTIHGLDGKKLVNQLHVAIYFTYIFPFYLVQSYSLWIFQYDFFIVW